MVDVATLRTILVADTRGYSSALTRASSQAQSFGSSMERASNRAAKSFEKGVVKSVKYGAAAVAVGLGYAVKKSMDFEKQLSALGAVSNATGRQMNAFRKQALKAGAVPRG